MIMRMAALVLVAVLAGALPVRAETVTVFAAASTSDALNDVIAAYEAQSGDDIVAVYEGSSTLARQIMQGAPADIYVSANERWMDALEGDGLLEPGTRRTVLTNELVLVTPRLTQIAYDFESATGLAEALGDRRLALADLNVPAGSYAHEVLTTRGEWDEIEDRIVYGGNVRTALYWVASAEAGAAIVYRSDALSTMSVVTLGSYDPASHTPITYPAAVLRDHARPAVLAFHAYMSGPDARAIFDSYGFGLPE